MKKLFIILLITLSPLAHADRFGGVWKHHFANAEGVSIRLSFKESRVAPTYGLHHGGRIARKIHVDAWGKLDYKTLEVRLIDPESETVIKGLEGTLIKENSNHQYAALIVKDSNRYPVDYIWLAGNKDLKHRLEVSIDGRTYQFRFEL